MQAIQQHALDVAQDGLPLTEPEKVAGAWASSRLHESLS
jgi:hypothetical protein